MNRVIHFEIPCDDIIRAKTFFEETFGWEIKNAGMPGVKYYLIITGSENPGIDGALMERQIKGGGTQAFTRTIQVENLDEILEKVEKNGGTLHNEKHDIPSVVTHIYIKDPESNIVGLLQPV